MRLPHTRCHTATAAHTKTSTHALKGATAAVITLCGPYTSCIVRHSHKSLALQVAGCPSLCASGICQLVCCNTDTAANLKMRHTHTQTQPHTASYKRMHARMHTNTHCRFPLPHSQNTHSRKLPLLHRCIYTWTATNQHTHTHICASEHTAVYTHTPKQTRLHTSACLRVCVGLGVCVLFCLRVCVSL